MEFKIHRNFARSWLRGPDNQRIMQEVGAKTLANYQGLAARRTGALAASARLTVGIGGIRKDRLVATVTATVPYAASHEFGTKGSDDRPVQTAANELSQALAMLESS